MLKRVVPETNLQEEREELSADDQDDISATQSKNLQNSYKIPCVYFNGAILVLYRCSSGVSDNSYEGTKNSSTKLLDEVSLKTRQTKELRGEIPSFKTNEVQSFQSDIFKKISSFLIDLSLPNMRQLLSESNAKRTSIPRLWKV